MSKFEQMLTNYINEKHNQDECAGFIDGFEKAVEVILEELDGQYVEVTDTYFVESSINIGINRAKSVIKKLIDEK
jgi:hypothetical protein